MSLVLVAYTLPVQAVVCIFALLLYECGTSPNFSQKEKGQRKLARHLYSTFIKHLFKKTKINLL